MPEGRFLKKKTSLSKPLAKLKNDTHRMLFTWAIPHLDIEGRMTGDIEVFKAVVCPLLKHITLQKIESFLEDAQNQCLIQRYNIDGNYYAQFLGFGDEQPKLRPDREAPSKIPPPTPDQLQYNSRPTQENAPTYYITSHQSNIYAQMFERFWKEYSRKIAKQQAFKAFTKLKPDDVLLETILEALRKQKLSREWQDPQFIPYPATWLNGERWKDEIKEPVSQDLRSYHKPAIVEPKEKLTPKERETAKKRLKDMSLAIGNKKGPP